MGRTKKIITVAALCALLIFSVIMQIISPSSAYFLSVFDKKGVNSVMVELIFDHLDFNAETNPNLDELTALGYKNMDGETEIAWGSKENPYVISQKYHIQNLSVLQNAGFFRERVQIDENGEEVIMTESIDYGDAEMSQMLEGDNPYSYDEGFADAGYSEVNPEEDGADFGMFDDGDMDFGPMDDAGYDDGYDE